MAVRVPAGESIIRFEYRTPGLYEGAVISAGALLLLLLYLLFCNLLGVKVRLPQTDTPLPDPEEAQIPSTADETGWMTPAEDAPPAPLRQAFPIGQEQSQPPASSAPSPQTPQPLQTPEQKREQAILDYLETLEELPPIDEAQQEKRQ